LSSEQSNLCVERSGSKRRKSLGQWKKPMSMIHRVSWISSLASMVTTMTTTNRFSRFWKNLVCLTLQRLSSSLRVLSCALFRNTQDDSPLKGGSVPCELLVLRTALGTLPEMVLVLQLFCPTEKSITATAFGIGVFPTSIPRIIESFETW